MKYTLYIILGMILGLLLGGCDMTTPEERREYYEHLVGMSCIDYFTIESPRVNQFKISKFCDCYKKVLSKSLSDKQISRILKGKERTPTFKPYECAQWFPAEKAKYSFYDYVLMGM